MGTIIDLYEEAIINANSVDNDQLMLWIWFAAGNVVEIAQQFQFDADSYSKLTQFVSTNAP